MPKATGRPSIYTPELAEEICLRLAEGESLRTICRDAHMPNLSAILTWVAEDRGGFHAMYTCARTIQAHNLAERALGEAMSARCNEDATAARLRFDALRWYAGKLLPKVYGDRMEVEQTVRAVVSDEPMTTEERVAKYGRGAGEGEGDAPTTH
jgi:hypothetical protein